MILTAQLPTLKLTLCRVAQSLFHGESPPSDPFLVLATFNGEFIRPEGSSIYIPERGLIYIQMRERFRCADGAFNRAPDCCSLRTGSLNPELSRIGLCAWLVVREWQVLARDNLIMPEWSVGYPHESRWLNGCHI